MKKRKYEIVSDTEHLKESEIKKALEKSPISRYAYALHDKDKHADGTKKKAHFHILVWLPYSVDSRYVAEWFGVAENFVQSVKSEVGALAYLTHQNAPDKFQYGSDIVKSNFDLDEEIEKERGKIASKNRLDEIITGIDDGTIREYDLYKHVSAYEYYKYRRAIESAYSFRKMRLREVEREMNCVFITGPSGSGKTTYAKRVAADRGMSVFVSSGSNDVLDGYMGQECIILDDLRPSCMGLSDLLKMLDNNTASTVKSRYFNKVLECRLIIITTTKPIETFFAEVFEKENESAIQLMRRCTVKMEFTADYIVTYAWNPVKQTYVQLMKTPNIVLAELGIRDYTKEEAINMVADVLGQSADALKELAQNSADYEQLDGQVELSDMPF